MEQIKELTKRLIANSFKELMLQTPFDKITIKMITDHASVIRPTFYNHFHDKYELVEWIVTDEVLDRVRELTLQKRGRDAVVALLTGFLEDRTYYHKAFEIEGQNGFTDMLHDKLTNLILELFGKDERETRFASRYYAGGLITLIRFAMAEEGQDMNYDEIIDMYVHTNRQLFEQLKNE